ncbi:mitochondrial fission process protein 1 isoform X4 [Corvus moneduloides]|uniref:mitochondrial fission process protein 1 isoform X4 n=1 Tax=Corvus moneduloides TaxID=1196302 RepID=UPI0013626127|nr:mitochondrial fission process protein 1 isoform X4 [Corvus moneduloides]
MLSVVMQISLWAWFDDVEGGRGMLRERWRAPWGRRSPTFTGTRGSDTWAHAQDPTRVGVAVVDTFVWQSLASVAIPGFTINRLCAASLALLGSLTRWPLPVRRWTTTALGLAAIPLIITPIDRTVDFLMDSSLRKLYGTPGEPPTSH